MAKSREPNPDDATQNGRTEESTSSEAAMTKAHRDADPSITDESAYSADEA